VPTPSDLDLILECLDLGRATALAAVSWNQADDDRDAERAAIDARYSAATAAVTSLLEETCPDSAYRR
jgi:hypothetical protein